MCYYLELHRLCFQLDRIRGDKRCGSVPVSTGDTPLTLRGLIRTFRYGMQYHGQMALFTGILVAFTQIIPEHQVQIFGFLRARVKVMLPLSIQFPAQFPKQSLPMAYMAFSGIMTLLGFQCPYITIQFGWFVSWIYLRFYKPNATDTIGGVVTYGDRSETFALTSWFPPFLQ